MISELECILTFDRMELISRFSNVLFVSVFSNLLPVEAHKILLAERSTMFEERKENKRLKDAVVEIIYVTSKQLCSMACNSHPQCLSINFCGYNKCEKNSDDVYSTTAGVANLVDNLGCNYFGMTKKDGPDCRKNGQFVDSNTLNDKCKISTKRINREWGPWETAIMDTATDFRKYEIRKLVIDDAHGGDPGNLESERVFEWMKFVHETKAWDDAQKFCIQLGGKLFSKVNGTEEQLDFCFQKLDYNSNWLGIHTDDHIVWVDTNGVIIQPDLLVWALANPTTMNANSITSLTGISSVK